MVISDDLVASLTVAELALDGEPGVDPPRFLMFKVENMVAVEASLVARRAA